MGADRGARLRKLRRMPSRRCWQVIYVRYSNERGVITLTCKGCLPLPSRGAHALNHHL